MPIAFWGQSCVARTTRQPPPLFSWTAALIQGAESSRKNLATENQQYIHRAHQRVLWLPDQLLWHRILNSHTLWDAYSSHRTHAHILCGFFLMHYRGTATGKYHTPWVWNFALLPTVQWQKKNKKKKHFQMQVCVDKEIYSWTYEPRHTQLQFSSLCITLG